MLVGQSLSPASSDIQDPSELYASRRRWAISTGPVTFAVNQDENSKLIGFRHGPHAWLYAFVHPICVASYSSCGLVG